MLCENVFIIGRLKPLMKLSPTLCLRLGLGLVLLWFGMSEIIDPETWSAYVPSLVEAHLPVPLTTFVVLHGIIEILLGSLLLLGFYLKLSSALVALHLFFIVLGVGYNEIGVRDFGLFMAAVALAMSEDNTYSLDAFISRR